MGRPTTRSQTSRSSASDTSLSSPSSDQSPRSRTATESRSVRKRSSRGSDSSASSSRGRPRKKARRTQSKSNDQSGPDISSRVTGQSDDAGSDSDDDLVQGKVRIRGPGGLEETIELVKGDGKKAPIITSIMAVTAAPQRLNLRSIAQQARNCEFKTRGARLTMRILDPKTTAVMFPSGIIVLMGNKTVEDSTLASRKFKRILEKLDVRGEFEPLRIVNIAATASMGFPLRLEVLATSLDEETTRCFYVRHYEPELFSAVICKVADPAVTVLMFSTGKMVLTGAKKSGDINAVFDRIFPILAKFRMVAVGPMSIGNAN